jgi:glycosyltransferase involved in cell wall biosynthesis
MKIVYATRAAVPYPSAASLNTVQMCQSLARLGNDVTLAIGRKLWRWPRVFDWKAQYGFVPQFAVQRIWEVPRHGWWFDRRIAELASRSNAFVYLRYPRWIEQAIRYDVPTVLELHSAVTATDCRLIGAGLRSGVLLGVVVITEALRGHLLSARELREWPERFLVAADAVDCSRFRVDGDEAGSRRVGYIGSLHPGKGIEIIVPLARALPHLEFDVYGGCRAQRRAWQAVSGQPGNLRFPGYVQPAEVPRLLRRYAIALLPNQPSVRLPNGDDIGRFTSPMKLFEYMAAGRAIVASDLPALREVLHDSVNCLLVPADDVVAWASAVDRLMNDSALRQRLGTQARRDARERHSYDARFRRILSTFLPAAA